MRLLNLLPYATWDLFGLASSSCELVPDSCSVLSPVNGTRHIADNSSGDSKTANMQMQHLKSIESSFRRPFLCCRPILPSCNSRNASKRPAGSRIAKGLQTCCTAQRERATSVTAEPVASTSFTPEAAPATRPSGVLDRLWQLARKGLALGVVVCALVRLVCPGGQVSWTFGADYRSDASAVSLLAWLEAL